MLNLVPRWITDEHVDVVRDRVEAKGGAPAPSSLRRAVLDEGLSVQTLHIGPYDAGRPRSSDSTTRSSRPACG